MSWILDYFSCRSLTANEQTVKTNLVNALKRRYLSYIDDQLELDKLPEQVDCNISYINYKRFSWPSARVKNPEEISIGNLKADDIDCNILNEILKNRMILANTRRAIFPLAVMNIAAALLFKKLEPDQGLFEHTWFLVGSIFAALPAADFFMSTALSSSDCCINTIQTLTKKELELFLEKTAKAQLKELPTLELDELISEADRPKDMTLEEFRVTAYRVIERKMSQSLDVERAPSENAELNLLSPRLES